MFETIKAALIVSFTFRTFDRGSETDLMPKLDLASL